MRRNILLFVGLACALALGCATQGGSRRVDGILPSVKTVGAASQTFGPPVETRSLEGGNNRYIWKFTQYDQVPGQYEEKEEIIGFDDGFPVRRIIRYWVPFHLVERTCFIQVTATPAGEVVDSSWQGNACDDLLTQAGRDKAYAPQAPPPQPAGGDRRVKEEPPAFYGDNIE